MGDKTLIDALDEIYLLRVLLASEAQILEAHTDYKSFPKSRRKFAEESVARMREAARGRVLTASRMHDRAAARRAYTSVTGEDTLTMREWQNER